MITLPSTLTPEGRELFQSVLTSLEQTLGDFRSRKANIGNVREAAIQLAHQIIVEVAAITAVDEAKSPVFNLMIQEFIRFHLTERHFNLITDELPQ